MEISVSQFKAKCLRIVESVEKEGQTVIITRHGRAAAQLIPVGGTGEVCLFGRSRGTAEIHGDLLSTHERWDVES
jgi:prevent-host-death family protein